MIGNRQTKRNPDSCFRGGIAACCCSATKFLRSTASARTPASPPDPEYRPLTFPKCLISFPDYGLRGGANAARRPVHPYGPALHPNPDNPSLHPNVRFSPKGDIAPRRRRGCLVGSSRLTR